VATLDEQLTTEEATEPWRDQRARWYQQKWLHLIAGLAVALLTVTFAGQRATAGARATLDNRLIASGAGADAGLIAVESEQLAAVREVAFTRGVGQLLQATDGPGLNQIVTPIQADSTVPMVDVMKTNGRVLLAVRSKGAPRPVASYHGLRLLSQALRNANGARGGRYSELVIFRFGPTLVTISPIMIGNTAVGAVMAMTPLADVLGRLNQETGAELTAYDANGDPIATTATFTPKNVPTDVARSLIGGGALETRYVYADHREKLGRLIVDHAAEAVLGVSLEDDSNVTGRAVSIYAALGLLCTVAILASFWARFTRDRNGYANGNGNGYGWHDHENGDL
jgi:hypothetical protein